MRIAIAFLTGMRYSILGFWELGMGNWQCLILGFPPVCLASGGNLIGASFIVGKPDNYAPPITHRQNARGTAPKGELGIGKKV
jgi:hypothetical protein